MRAIGTITLALIVLVWSVTTIFIDAITSPYRLAAERLEAGAKRELSYFQRIDRSLDTHVGLSVCHREMVRSAVSIRLAGLDVLYRSGDFVGRADALAKAGRLLRDGLRCFPHDGNLWLRLAIVEFARAGSSHDIEQMLELSASAAPSEAWIIAPRIAFAAKLLEFRSTDPNKVIRRDIGTFVRFARAPEVAEVYLQVGEEARQIFEESISSLSAERRSALEDVIASVTSERRP